ncbi:MAG: hypothetical protein CL957_08125 [Euryarchaeota archaeon]|nr:hypothetical protein [Euryarchaeota archaeon]
MEIQPAHLQLHSGEKLNPEQRDAIRAEIIRSRLQSLDPPAIVATQESEELHPPSDTVADS